MAAEYALYQAEHMQLALFVPLESCLPAAAAVRLARHIAELDDEHAALEVVLESFLARDEQEEERVSLAVGELRGKGCNAHGTDSGASKRGHGGGGCVVPFGGRRDGAGGFVGVV